MSTLIGIMGEPGTGKYTVYMHKNKANGKVYIGITSRSVSERWLNGKGYTHGRFKTAINKYGWDGFEHTILYENLSQADAEKKEIELINQYNSKDRRFGYNLCSGGRTRSGFKHSEEARKKIAYAARNMSDETKEKIRIANTGYVMPKEQKEKISNSNKGKSFTKIHRQRLKDSHIGKAGYWNGKSRPSDTCDKISEKLGTQVLCINTNKIYTSMNRAAKDNNVSIEYVKNSCEGKKSKKNITFKYL